MAEGPVIYVEMDVQHAGGFSVKHRVVLPLVDPDSVATLRFYFKRVQVEEGRYAWQGLYHHDEPVFFQWLTRVTRVAYCIDSSRGPFVDVTCDTLDLTGERGSAARKGAVLEFLQKIVDTVAANVARAPVAVFEEVPVSPRRPRVLALSTALEDINAILGLQAAERLVTREAANLAAFGELMADSVAAGVTLGQAEVGAKVHAIHSDAAAAASVRLYVGMDELELKVFMREADKAAPVTGQFTRFCDDRVLNLASVGLGIETTRAIVTDADLDAFGAVVKLSEARVNEIAGMVSGPVSYIQVFLNVPIESAAMALRVEQELSTHLFKPLFARLEARCDETGLCPEDIFAGGKVLVIRKNQPLSFYNIYGFAPLCSETIVVE